VTWASPGGDVSLEGSVAIVTGSTGGIGRATCVALASAGATVVAAGRSPEGLAETVRACERAAAARGSAGENEAGPGSEVALALPGCDVRDPAAMERMAGETLARWGRIDVLVTATGAARSRLPYPVASLETAAWDEVVDTNLGGVFLANRAVLGAMKRQGSGQIVNISSARGATSGRALAAAYCASKFGVMGLSEVLAEEVRSFGIRVHVVLPDAVDTPLIAGTTLAPHGALSPALVGQLIVDLLLLPSDTVLARPLVAPFSTSARRAHP
jgi:3-oxoacyl-[acyl-carrier protein] reductase